MAFTDTEKVDIRRFCGYPVFGESSDPAFGYRYFQQYGTLEWKLNHLTADEETIVRTVYLPNLASLESAILTTSDNLDTDKAAVWTHNPHEQRDREALFESWRRRLCEFLGVAFGTGLMKNTSGFSVVV